MGTTARPTKPAPPVKKTVLSDTCTPGSRRSAAAGGGSDDLADRARDLRHLVVGEVGVHRHGEVPGEEVGGDRAVLPAAVHRLEVRGVGPAVASVSYTHLTL